MDTNLAYADECRDELINGFIVMMSPRPKTDHNLTTFNIASIFKHYLKGKRCTPFPDGEDLFLSEKDRFVPDGMIVCDPDKIKNDGVYGAPDLVVEVLSPATAKRDKGYKKDAYEQAGVKEYWIVNTTDKSIEQYFLTDGKYVLNEVYSVYPDYILKGMTEEEIAAIPTEFKCSLFDDLLIKLEDVFERIQ